MKEFPDKLEDALKKRLPPVVMVAGDEPLIHLEACDAVRRVARERGIEITESSSSESGDFATLVRATLVTETDDITASATVFGNQFLRLVRLGPYQLDAYLDGALLIFRHRDVPGLIGFIGTVLGRHHVNIAHMSLGRQQDEPGGEAVAVLNLDNLPPPAALEEIAAHPEAIGVELVSLPPAQAPLPWLPGG